MPLTGNNLAINFSVCNQLGTKRNTLQGGTTTAQVDTTVFKAEIDAIFGGEMLNMSYRRWELTEAEKAATTGTNPERYSQINYPISYGTKGDDSSYQRGYLAGISKSVQPAAIAAFVEEFLVLADDSTPTDVFIGSPKKSA